MSTPNPQQLGAVPPVDSPTTTPPAVVPVTAGEVATALQTPPASAPDAGGVIPIPKINLDGPPPEHPRYKEIYAEAMEKRRMEERLNQMGVQSLDQLENALRGATTAAQRAQILDQVESMMQERPEEFANFYAQVYPEAFNRLVQSRTGVTPQTPNPLDPTPPSTADPQILRELNDLKGKFSRFDNVIRQTEAERAAVAAQQHSQRIVSGFNKTVDDYCEQIGIGQDSKLLRDSLRAITRARIEDNQDVLSRVNSGDFRPVYSVFHEVAREYLTGGQKPAQSTATPASPAVSTPAVKPLPVPTEAKPTGERYNAQQAHDDLVARLRAQAG